MRCRLPVAMLLLSLASSPADAHPPTVAEARLRLGDVLQDEGLRSFSLEVDCDVAAMMTGAEPGHLDDGQKEAWRTASPDEQATLLNDAEKRFTQQTSLSTGQKNGPKIEAVEVAWPKSLSTQPLPGEDPPTAKVVVRGTIPANGEFVSVRLPPELGKVSLIIEAPDGPDLRQQFPASEASWPVALKPEITKEEAEDAAVVAALVAEETTKLEVEELAEPVDAATYLLAGIGMTLGMLLVGVYVRRVHLDGQRLARDFAQRTMPSEK